MIIVINSNKWEGDLMKTLKKNTFKPGNSYLVKSIDYDNKASKQLIDMGITPDTTIYIDSAAPLGEPLVVKVKDYKVALRSRDLEALDVEMKSEYSFSNTNIFTTA